MKTSLLFALIFALGAIFLWWIAGAISSVGGFQMSASGWIAMILGVLLTAAVGVVLMAIVFYSDRRGYDEAPELERHDHSVGKPR